MAKTETKLDQKLVAMGKRLQQAREHAGHKSVADGAKYVNENYNTYYAYESGRRPMTGENLKKIEKFAKSFGVSAQWLMFNVGQMIPDDAPPEPRRNEAQPASTKGFVLAPGAIAELDLRAGAGGGGVPPEPIVGKEGVIYQSGAIRDQWLFPDSFVRDELRLTLGKTEIVSIRGNSMVPILNDGDRAVIDRTDTDVRQGGIFAVYDGDGVIVKQVELLRDEEPGTVLCTSANRDYQSFKLRLDESTFIIGRVSAKIARM